MSDGDLLANYAPVGEVAAPLDARIVGSIPEGLCGTYLRIGPNRAAAQGAGGLWFDGQGMVHAVRLDRAGAAYRSRWVRTPSLDATVPPFGRATEPASAGLARTLDGAVLALSDVGRPWRVDAVDLETDGPDETPIAGVSLLPHVVQLEGAVATIGTSWAESTLWFLERAAGPSWTATGSLEAPRRPFLHDLALVGERVLVTDLPWRRGPFGPVWDADSGASFLLADRAGSGARSIDITPTHVSHVAGAWVDGDDDVVVACRRPVPGVDRDERNDHDATPGSLRRWTIRADDTVDETDIDPEPCDFPALFDDGRRVAVARPTGTNYTVASAVSVVDLGSGERVDHRYGPGRWGGECTPVALPSGDAVLVGFVYDAGRAASELVVLDAGDLAEPIARILLDRRVPFGLHGIWIPAG